MYKIKRFSQCRNSIEVLRKIFSYPKQGTDWGKEGRKLYEDIINGRVDPDSVDDKDDPIIRSIIEQAKRNIITSNQKKSPTDKTLSKGNKDKKGSFNKSNGLFNSVKGGLSTVKSTVKGTSGILFEGLKDAWDTKDMTAKESRDYRLKNSKTIGDVGKIEETYQRDRENEFKNTIF